MNSKIVKASLLLISASALFVAGCGPMDTNAFIGANGDILSKDAMAMQEEGQDQMKDMRGPAQGQGRMMGMQARGPAQEDMKGMEGQGQQEGCPTGGCPTGGCATGNCEPAPEPDTHRTIQMPDQVEYRPTQVTPTGELRHNTDVEDYHTTRHVYHPSRNDHTYTLDREKVKRHFLKVVNHPTTQRVVNVVRTGSARDEVMPTEEVTAPVVDFGCSAAAPAPAPAPVPVVPVVRPVVFVPVYSYYGLYW